MAGDWIKLEHTTPDKPEVYRMADSLKIDPDAVVGKLARMWIWADLQSVNGNSIDVTDSTIDRITACTGFSAALRSVGWLDSRSDGILLPNFTRHNGQTAKVRADTYRRVSNHRKKSNAESVTDPLQNCYQSKEEETELENNKEKKEIKNPSAFTSFIRAWELAFQQSFKEPYIFKKQRDGFAVNALIKLQGYTVESLVEVAKKAWAITDERKGWHCVHHSRTIHGFQTYFTEIRNGLGMLKTNTTTTSKEEMEKSWSTIK